MEKKSQPVGVVKCMDEHKRQRTTVRPRRITLTVTLICTIWSSAKSRSAWLDTMPVLVARGRAQVGAHSAKSDWSKRIRDCQYRYMDYDDHGRRLISEPRLV